MIAQCGYTDERVHQLWDHECTASCQWQASGGWQVPYLSGMDLRAIREADDMCGGVYTAYFGEKVRMF